MKIEKTLWFTSNGNAYAAVKQFKAAYPPQGYDSKGTVFYSEAHGMWGAFLTRSNSCG